MDFESEDGSIIIPVEGSGFAVEIGRGLRFSAADRTVSRRHLSLRLLDGKEGNPPDGDARVSFEVIGRNPIWVYSAQSGAKRVHRRSDKGVLEAGDRISLSLKNQTFLELKRKRAGGDQALDESVLDAVKRRERRTLERRKAKVIDGDGYDEWDIQGLDIDLGFTVDVSDIDPVKEFGFMVKGHEFDRYPLKKIRALKEWNWFLEEPGDGGDTDDDDHDVMTGDTSFKGKGRSSKKKVRGIEDEDWTAESEDDKAVALGVERAKRPRYTTRSKNPKKSRNGTLSNTKPSSVKDAELYEDDCDEEDETLGGFIVDEEGEEAEGEEEEEEEELTDEEYEDD